MIPIRVPKSFRITAHRGASVCAPENTLPAFQLAKEMSVGEVDLDARLSTDNVVVICHDATLERYGHGPRSVEDLASTELLSVDMGSWFSPFKFANTTMMTLDQLLSVFADDFVFYIELKGRAEGLPRAVYSSVDSHTLVDRAIFTSFSLDQLSRMRAI